MLTLNRLIFFIITGTTLLFYAFFWRSYLDQRNETAEVMVATLHSDISDITYTLAKSIENINEVARQNAFLDRKAANSELISGILVSQGNRILLFTDPEFRFIPNAEELALNPQELDLNTLVTKKAISANVRIFDNARPQRITIYFFLDKQYIGLRLYRNFDKLIYLQGFPTIIILVLLWFILHNTVVRPFASLRMFANNPEHKPNKFRIRELESVRITLADTYERLEAEKNELYRLSTIDELSGLANRNSLNDTLKRMISDSSRHNREFAVLFLDIDNFKSVNDTLGHKAGDNLIKSIADAIREMMRANDFIARIGGDEFVIVLNQYETKGELIQILERLLSRVKQPWNADGNHFYLSASLGISFYPINGNDPVSLLKNADIAMYEAKRAGRNCYRFFSDSLNKIVVEEVALDREMRRALINGEFELYYQAKTNVSDNAVIGVEALLRWNHPTDGLLSPPVFIHIAERTGFIIELGRWIISQAAAQQVRWKNSGLCDISVSVNISPQQFRDNEFLAHLLKIVAETRIESRKLDIEITESTFLENTERNLSLLHSIHGSGVTISLDDFGTGYSSLSFLKRFPIDTIKIDKSFIDDFGSKSGAVFLKTIVAMGKSLNMDIVSEGIETNEQLAYLNSIGCDYFQGYLCSKPVRSSDFEKFLKRKLRISDPKIIDFTRLS